MVDETVEVDSPKKIGKEERKVEGGLNENEEVVKKSKT